MNALLRTISDADLNRARHDSTDSWSVGNSVLYRLVKEHPTHTDERAVVAKIWLIGRSYAAAIERSVIKSHPGEGVDKKYARIAKAFRSCGVDRQLARLDSAGPGKLLDLSEPLRIHGRILETLRPMARSVPRSFVSKYLHFHAPAWFFIYDSVASNGLRRVLGPVGVPRELPAIGDPTYRQFVGRAWLLREELAKRSKPLTPRQLDILLLWCGV